jgi:hypothetical protein
MPINFLKQTLSTNTAQTGMVYSDVKDLFEYKLYKYSCLLFALAGIIRGYQGNKIDAINLIIQSMLSYMSDVYSLGLHSKWHIVDRYFATCISIYHFYTLETRKSLVINLILFFIGFNYLNQSRYEYNNHSYNFLITHTKWHCIPPLMALTSKCL